MKGLNQKGSTLAYVLIIIAILSLLGVTVLSATLMGYKMKVSSGFNKKAFYIAEGGLEQANAIIEQTLQDAVEYANTTAREKLSADMKKERDHQEEDRADIGKSYEAKYKSPYFYQIKETPTGRYEYDYRGNITAEFDQFGNEIKPTLMKKSEGTEALVKLDDTDVNPIQGGVVEAYSNKKLNEFFAEAYVAYLKDKNIAPTTKYIKDRLEAVATFKASSYETPNEFVKGTTATVKDFGTLVQDENGLYSRSHPENVMEIVFKSTAEAKASAVGSASTRSLETKFEIDIPPYNLPIMKGNEIVKLKANALFDKAISTDKDFIVMGNNVTVNGNLYAKGHDTSIYDTDFYRYGGIIVGDALAFGDEAKYPSFKDITKKQGSLTVNGVVATSGYLQTRNKNSHIIVKGNVYCNSLIAQQDWENDEDGAFSGCSILLNNDLNLLDNLNLNCTNTQITVKGNLFGFSDGTGTSAAHNQSSSIVINDSGIGEDTNTTSLTIEGAGVPKHYSFDAVNAAGHIEKNIAFELPNGIYIAGTAYVNYGLVITIDPLHEPALGSVAIDTDGRWEYTPNPSTPATFTDTFTLKVHNNTFGGNDYLSFTVNENVKKGVIASNYQTGESISVAGNYKAYSMVLDPTIIKKYAGDGYLYLANLSDEDFDSVAPLSLVQRLPTRDMTVYDKSLYSRMAREQERNFTNLADKFFNFGKEKVTINKDNMRYTLGNSVETKKGSTERDFQEMKSPIESANGKIGASGLADDVIQLGLKYKGREFNYYTKKMSDPQIDNYLGRDTSNTRLDVQDHISDFFDFPVNESSNLSSRGTSDPIYFVSSKDAPKSLVIRGENSGMPNVYPSGSAVCDVANGSNGFVDGVIVTAGDVYISGKLNYKGIIAAGGNIYIFDNEEKTFTNDYNPSLLVFKTTSTPTSDYSRMIENISNNTVVKKILIDSLTETQELGDYFKKDSDWKKEITFTKDVDNAVLSNGSVKTYTSRLSNFIRVSQWKQD